MNNPPTELTESLESIRRAMAVVANDRPTREQTAEWNAADKAMAQRIRAALPGVPLHHAYAVLQALRVTQRLDAAAAVPAGLVAVTPTTTDRDRIAEAVQHGPTWMLPRSLAEEITSAVLAVLPAGSEDTTTTRADVLREAADHLDAKLAQLFADWPSEPKDSPGVRSWREATAELRRLAAETQPPEPVKLPFVHTDDDGDQLDIGAVMASTYDGEAPVVYVAADQHQGDQVATVYVRPERVEQVVTALRAARKAAEALPTAASAGVQTDEETNHG